VDSAWEQKKPEARKRLEKRTDSPPSAARFVRQPYGTPDSIATKNQHCQLNLILQRTTTLATDQKLTTYQNACEIEPLLIEKPTLPKNETCQNL